MAIDNLISVEVVYALPTEQKVISLSVEKNTTIETVIDRSGILDFFPEIDLTKQKVGVFGKLKKLSEKVEEGDRVEIYRPLMVDPKDARRKRVGK